MRAPRLGWVARVCCSCKPLFNCFSVRNNGRPSRRGNARLSVPSVKRPNLSTIWIFSRGRTEIFSISLPPPDHKIFDLKLNVFSFSTLKGTKRFGQGCTISVDRETGTVAFLQSIYKQSRVLFTDHPEPVVGDGGKTSRLLNGKKLKTVPLKFTCTGESNNDSNWNNYGTGLRSKCHSSVFK